MKKLPQIILASITFICASAIGRAEVFILPLGYLPQYWNVGFSIDLAASMDANVCFEKSFTITLVRESPNYSSECSFTAEYYIDGPGSYGTGNSSLSGTGFSYFTANRELAFGYGNWETDASGFYYIYITTGIQMSETNYYYSIGSSSLSESSNKVAANIMLFY